MLISVNKVKSYMGIADVEDEAVDNLIAQSNRVAQSLVDAYVGFRIEMSEEIDTRTHLVIGFSGVVYRLPAFPAKVFWLKADGRTLTPDVDYMVDPALGTIEFMSEQVIRKMEVLYTAGFEPETLPSDLEAALVNMSMAIYNSGGKIVPPSADSGVLKSMTMFDAMSMSFETGGVDTLKAASAEGLVGQWAFTLDKYAANSKYVMG